MSTRLRTLGLTIPLLLALAVPAAAGPPWIAIEYPVNPHDPETRDALLVVRTYHHGTPLGSAVTAEALGTVEGRGTALPLDVTATSRPGVYAVSGELPGSNDWVVSITRHGPDGGNRATALVAMNSAREVLAVRVPSRTAEDGRWVVPRDPTTSEVEAMLRTATAMSDAARASRGAVGAGAALLLLVLVPSGAWLVRRERRH